MASDVLAVLKQFHVDEKAAMVGWSDGTRVARILAIKSPQRVSRVFFFDYNMDPSGTKEFKFTPVVGRCLSRHTKNYARLYATLDEFDEFSGAVQKMMATEPNYSTELGKTPQNIRVVTVQSEGGEFIKHEHASPPETQQLVIPSGQFAQIQMLIRSLLLREWPSRLTLVHFGVSIDLRRSGKDLTRKIVY